MIELEKNHDYFKLQSLLDAREVTLDLFESIQSQLKIGMSENDLSIIVDHELSQRGVQKKWHPNKIRFNKNTTLSFKEKSAPTKLHEDSIFFLDLGPVFDNHEADIGRTFTLSKNEQHQKIITHIEEIFFQVRDHWEKFKKSGLELYQFAKKITESRGYIFNDKMLGHRIGSFPHALFYKGPLSDVGKEISPNLWVLEILISHSSGEFGAFYEDIIY